jgi:hypothetical protein
MRDLANRIGTMTPAAEEVWFRNLLFRILNSALHDHHNVTIGLKKYVPLAALGTRNLLELRIVTTYILQSGKNRHAFKTDGTGLGRVAALPCAPDHPQPALCRRLRKGRLTLKQQL